ncbi:SMC-Scp complex subunit ScpB, partial [Calditrichota bacterium]
MRANLSQVIEALLFASDSPLTIPKLKSIISDKNAKDIREAINELNTQYDKNNSALSVIEVANGFQMVTRPEYADYVQELFKGRNASRLTARAMETLAIIAYEQPITKQRMEHVRGVNVDGVVK